jgi:hypothetical protein
MASWTAIALARRQAAAQDGQPIVNLSIAQQPARARPARHQCGPTEADAAGCINPDQDEDGARLSSSRIDYLD